MSNIINLKEELQKFKPVLEAEQAEISAEPASLDEIQDLIEVLRQIAKNK